MVRAGRHWPALRFDRSGAYQRNSRMRMISGIGIPTSHRRIGIACSFQWFDFNDALIFRPTFRPEVRRPR